MTTTQDQATDSMVGAIYTIEFEDGVGDWLPLASDISKGFEYPRRAMVRMATYLAAGPAVAVVENLCATRARFGTSNRYRVVRWGPSGRTVVHSS